MKKIELNEYQCPICSNDLRVDSVSLMGTETKTYFSCHSCNEKYFSSEIPDVSQRSPEFTCLFCHVKPQYLSLSNDWSDYWRCDACDCSFEARYLPDWDGLNTINMYAELKGKRYCIRQFLAENLTRIETIPVTDADAVVKIAEFDFLMPHVNPQNIVEKLPVYILFS
jgi:transcription elongation factor Elf1